MYPFYLKNKTVMVLQKMYEMIPSTANRTLGSADFFGSSFRRSSSASVVERIHWVDDAGVTRPACMGAKTLRKSELNMTLAQIHPAF